MTDTTSQSLLDSLWESIEPSVLARPNRSGPVSFAGMGELSRESLDAADIDNDTEPEENLLPRKRMIDPAIWSDPDVGSLSDRAFKLFVCLVSNADDDGRLVLDPRQLRHLAWGFVDEPPALSIVLDALTEVSDALRSFVTWEQDGQTFGCFLKWHLWQAVPKPSASQIPMPPGYQLAPSSTGRLCYQSLTARPPLPDYAEAIPELSGSGSVAVRELSGSGSVAVSLKERKKERKKEEREDCFAAQDARASSGEFALAPPDGSPKERKRRGAPRLTAAQTVFQKITGFLPKKEFQPRFDAACADIGEDELGKRISAWVNAKCNPANYVGMLEAIETGQMPAPRKPGAPKAIAPGSPRRSKFAPPNSSESDIAKLAK